MIKKQQKWIALLVVLTFIWLLHVSAMPLAAATASEHVSPANAEQAPSFVEFENTSGSQGKGKSILPYILIGVGVAAVAAVLLLVVFKTQYDIVGTWTIHITYDNDDNVWDSITAFSGDKKSGTTLDNYDATGTYTVDGKNVTFTLSWLTTTMTFTGKFNGKDKMSGRFTETPHWVGPWTAVRSASSAGKIKPYNMVKRSYPTKAPGRR